jgi:hypothetical protein
MLWMRLYRHAAMARVRDLMARFRAEDRFNDPAENQPLMRGSRGLAPRLPMFLTERKDTNSHR